jgi:hypothetical protein
MIDGHGLGSVSGLETLITKRRHFKVDVSSLDFDTLKPISHKKQRLLTLHH